MKNINKKTALFLKAGIASLILFGLIVSQNGCLRIQTGNTLFQHSMIAQSYGTHYGYSDKQWENALSPVYEKAYSFNEFNIARVVQQNKYGLINTKGVYVLEPSYSFIGAFSGNGLAPFLSDEGNLGYLTTNGTVIIPATLSTEKGIFYFHNCGLSVFYDKNSYGLLNEFGQIIMDPKYESISDELLNYETIAAARNGKFALFNMSGNAITEYIYDSVSYGGENTLIVTMEGQYYFIDKTGNLCFEAGFDEAYAFSKNGLALVKSDNLFGYINRDGRFEFQQRFTEAGSFTECGLAMAKASNGKYGYINETGEFAIKAKYLEASDFISDSTLSKNLAVIKTKKGYGVINASGRTVVRPTYSSLSITVFDDDYFVGTTETDIIIFKRSGKVLKTFAQGEINLEK